MCYYGSWAVYRPGAGKFDIEDIDPFLCTHLIYGFAGLDSTTWKIFAYDPWNDLDENGGKGRVYLSLPYLSRALFHFERPDIDRAVETFVRVMIKIVNRTFF
jgi:hypothetical protein